MLPRAYHSVGAGQARGRCGIAGSHPDGGGGTEGAAHLTGGEAHADSVVPSRQRDLRRLPPPLLRCRWTKWWAGPSDMSTQQVWIMLDKTIFHRPDVVVFFVWLCLQL